MVGLIRFEDNLFILSSSFSGDQCVIRGRNTHEKVVKLGCARDGSRRGK